MQLLVCCHLMQLTRGWASCSSTSASNRHNSSSSSRRRTHQEEQEQVRWLETATGCLCTLGVAAGCLAVQPQLLGPQHPGGHQLVLLVLVLGLLLLVFNNSSSSSCRHRWLSGGCLVALPAPGLLLVLNGATAGMVMTTAHCRQV